MTMKIATRKATQADVASKREVIDSANLVLVSIDEEGRPASAEGKDYIVRNAVVITRKGEHKPIEVWGTEKQWPYFNGTTVNAEFAVSKKTGKPRWYFSPVASGPAYENQDDM